MFIICWKNPYHHCSVALSTSEHKKRRFTALRNNTLVIFVDLKNALKTNLVNTLKRNIFIQAESIRTSEVSISF